MLGRYFYLLRVSFSSQWEIPQAKVDLIALPCLDVLQSIDTAISSHFPRFSHAKLILEENSARSKIVKSKCAKAERFSPVVFV